MTSRQGGALVAAIILGLLWYGASRPAHRAPGVLAPEIPDQKEVSAPPPTFDRGNAHLTAVASFDIHARVLSRENYWFDSGAKLVPVDLALGWGRMSDSSVLDKISISQYGRFYYWSVSEFPIPQQEIVESSANMHLVPATSTIERAIKRSHAGDVVHFSGYLVNATMPGGAEWKTSMTRSDSGGGACELVWVEQFEIEPR